MKSGCFSIRPPDSLLSMEPPPVFLIVKQLFNPLLGPAAFNAVEAALAGKPVEKNIVVKDEVYEQSVAKDVIAQRKY